MKYTFIMALGEGRQQGRRYVDTIIMLSEIRVAANITVVAAVV